MKRRYKRYLHTLWLALAGRNPYLAELERTRADYERVAEQARQLEQLQQKMADAVGRSEAVLCSMERRVQALDDDKAKACEQLKSCRKLIENLRERISDKDLLIESQQQAFRDRIERTKQGYQQRIDSYIKEVDTLRGQLTAARGGKIAFT